MAIAHFDVNIKPMLNCAIISIFCPKTFKELKINQILKQMPDQERTMLT